MKKSIMFLLILGIGALFVLSGCDYIESLSDKEAVGQGFSGSNSPQTEGDEPQSHCFASCWIEECSDPPECTTYIMTGTTVSCVCPGSDCQIVIIDPSTCDYSCDCGAYPGMLGMGR